MPNIRRSKQESITLNIPTWVGAAYLACGIILLPWIIYLAVTLPTHHRSANWDVIWTGFDIGLLLALLCTAIAAYARSLYIVLAAAASGTLLLVDAWFDLISEQGHTGFYESVLLAVLVELPLAFISFYVASRALRRGAKPHLVKKPL